jgi:hypothetical protein
MTRLYMLNGEDEVRFHDLEGDTFYLGRAPDNDIASTTSTSPGDT